jgi:exodeoxyribonuclease VII large subunit
LEVHSLYQLQTFIRRALALNLAEPVWISAELAECDENRGHFYLQLVEQGDEESEIRAQARAVIWQATGRRWERTHRMPLNSLLQVGRKLQLLVEVQYHQRYGLSLQVEDIDPTHTLGQLAKDRAATIARLQAEGLWELNRLTVLPLVPQRLAIISSRQAAGLQDFLQQLTRNAYHYRFQTDLFSAAMQGPRVSMEVRQQLRTIARRRTDYDLIVLLRGGGARLDLAVFDDLELARAIAQSPLPVLSGIGHDQDQSVVDLLAHTSVKTPTAAAAFLIQRLHTFEQGLEELGARLHLRGAEHLAESFRQLEAHYYQLRYVGKSQLRQLRWRLDTLATSLEPTVQVRLKHVQQHLAHLAQLQELLDVERTLSRGFALLRTAEGQWTGKPPLQPGDKLHIRHRNGEQEIEVK